MVENVAACSKYITFAFLTLCRMDSRVKATKPITGSVISSFDTIGYNLSCIVRNVAAVKLA